MVLYINSCVREDSRTDKIARAVLGKIGDDYEEIFLPKENLQPLSMERLDKRTKLIESGNYSDEMFTLAKRFASADTVVISAPYWDLSFPSLLKLFFENIYVTGIVSEYTSDGKPHGLCKANRLIYVTTAGGPYVPQYSYGYIKDLCENCFGIPEVRLIYAEMLDVDGYNAEEIISKVIDNIYNLL